MQFLNTKLSHLVFLKKESIEDVVELQSLWFYRPINYGFIAKGIGKRDTRQIKWKVNRKKWSVL